ncbi:DMT family transporter [Allorhizobium sp. BGMRC 0089]|uniref:DMT family transporter n=1 Tax=Allorhizobium sonneratiae TaxID=2934936 RepID=UPI0020343B54|nr:DMT family transporter [Allorhizobium sonneratiae]MCM2290782.1 DMT family transporter [Allorhizobium sonneratiae]
MTSTMIGYLFTILAYSVFSIQDGISKHLGDSYSPIVVATVRYWALTSFGLLMASRSKQGIRRVVQSKRPVLQVVRGLLLMSQIVLSILAFHYVGLAHSEAIFAAGPIFVAIMSVPILGEQVGWRRWTAIAFGLIGVMIILSPGKLDAPVGLMLLPLLCSLSGALYGILTRLVSRNDSALTSFFYIGMVGFIVMNCLAPFFFTGIKPHDWLWMMALCCTGITGHFSLIRAYEKLNAVVIQPIGYFQLVATSLIAVFIFGEALTAHILIGSAIIVSAGLFTIWREHVVQRRAARQTEFK